MTTTLKKIIASLGITAAIVVPGGAVAVSMPLSSADNATSGCVASGQTVDHCDHMYISDMNRWVRGPNGLDPLIDGSPAAVSLIEVAHNQVNWLIQHPTKEGFLSAATKIKQNRANEGLPPISDQDIINGVDLAVHWYGPPGLEDTLSAALNGS